ncbi:(2Fe-2S)-binding protein [Streptomyces sp. NPDC054796]
MTTAPGTRSTPEIHPFTSGTPGLLALTYRRLTARCEALDVHVAEPASAADAAHPVPLPHNWTDGEELTTDTGTLAAFTGAEATRIHDRFAHTARPDVAASRALHGYAWSVALLMSGAWYMERRVPRIRTRDVRLDLTTGALEVVPGTGFACLADDPAAAAELPGARVVVDEEALRAELRAAVADHLRPLLAAVGPLTRRGPRALWGMVADDLVSGIWYLGRVLGQEERAVRAADEVLPGAVSPFPGGAAFRRLTGRDGRSYPTRTRIGCCLHYTVRPDEACATCPRTCDAERLRRLES